MNPDSKAFLWAGRIFTALPTLMLTMSAEMKLSGGADFMKQWAAFGYKPEQALTIGAIELACAVIYAIPQTAALSAVLLTGYLGGAVATHVRAGEPAFAPVLLGAMVWAGLYFRDGRVRDLLPLRKS